MISFNSQGKYRIQQLPIHTTNTQPIITAASGALAPLTASFLSFIVPGQLGRLPSAPSLLLCGCSHTSSQRQGNAEGH